jgi:cobalt/nickel transport system permease protein
MATGRRPPSVDRLHHDVASPIHRLPAAPKLAGLVAFVVVVALTPRRSVGLLAIDAAVLVGVVALARLPVLLVAARLAAIGPFVAFAVLLPLIGTGEQTTVVGMEVSVDGLWAAWGIVAKAVLGATASIVVTATTPLPDLLRGLERLRVPRLVVAIVASMLRYLDLVVEDLGRSRRAMAARGHDPRWIWQVKPIASSLGARFVRTYERGERVHLAMVARGFDGSLPASAPSGSSSGSPATSGLGAATQPMLPAIAAAALLVATTAAT